MAIVVARVQGHVPGQTGLAAVVVSVSVLLPGWGRAEMADSVLQLDFVQVLGPALELLLVPEQGVVVFW